jgi:hypothetical protein
MNLLAAFERPDDVVEDRRDDALRGALGKISLRGDRIDQLGLRHECSFG